MKLYAASTINEIKAKYGFKLSKSLGQNFLIDKNIIDKIVEESNITEKDTVVEIGPGIGVLTNEVAKYAKNVIAIEIDKNLLPILQETLAEHDNIEVVNSDVLKIDLNELIEAKGAENVRFIGNLPYYITTPIIMKILEENVNAKSITIMMQKEVADRITAKPGSKNCGAISLAAQYYAEVTKIIDVPRTVFYPHPNVDSAVLRLDIREKKSVSLNDEKVFFDCIKAAFSQRRKMLSNALCMVEGVDKEKVLKALKNAEVDGSRRGETLNMEEFARLANSIGELI